MMYESTRMSNNKGMPYTNRVKTGLGESMKQGFGVGIGSSMGQRMVGSLFTAKKPEQSPIDCKNIMVDYDRCIITSDCTSDVMRNLIDGMIQCQKESRLTQ
jgi:hypothetical protein